MTTPSNKSLFFSATVSENVPLNENHNLITLAPKTETPVTFPGQFYMIGLPDSKDPLLKRPFSCLSREDGLIKMLYRVRGKTTSLMRKIRPGETVELIGPLGNGYPEPPENKTPLVVAGGVGIASVYPVISSLMDKAIVLYGGRGANEILMLDELRSLSKQLHISTEDGSIGKKGLVTALFGDIPEEDYIVYSCGPKGMLKAVSDYATGRGLEGYISLEEHMACGVGACLGCVTKTTSGYRRVCKEGPVFAIKEIIF